jgi:hypothetical protein
MRDNDAPLDSAQNQTPFNPTVTYDKNLSAKDLAADQSKVGGAVGVINANWSKLSDQEKATVGDIKSIDVSGSAQRSYVQESTGKLTFTQDYVSKSSKGWLASAIAHDGEQLRQTELTKLHCSSEISCCWLLTGPPPILNY